MRLQPDNAAAMQLRERIWGNLNILGLPADMDIIPNFNEYIQAYTSFGSLIMGYLAIGANQLIDAADIDRLRTVVALQKQQTENLITATKDDLTIAQTEQKNSADDVDDAKKRLADTNTQIQSALAEMNHHSISFGAVIGVVGEVAGAVVSVVAAIPTAGASLVALVPSVMALTKTVIDNAPPIVESLFSGDAPDVSAITAAYKKVNKKDVTEVINDAKVIVNFVKLLDKLAAGTTPDNSKYVALVQKGVELIHEVMLADRQVSLAKLKTAAVSTRLNLANQLLQATEDLMGKLSMDAGIIRQAGLNAIHRAQLSIDSLVGFAFRAQRSVEIYTLKSESGKMYFDAGYVHPDLDRTYQENQLNDLQLIAAYTESWGKLLQPVKMQEDYLSYFDDNSISTDSRRLPFNDPDLLQRIKDNHVFDFTIEMTDIPAGHFDAKIQNVYVAFVGANSPSGVISCEIRHGDRYVQMRPDGTISTQLLKPRLTTKPARTTPLELGGVDFNSDSPLTAPQSLAFWGRGLGGRWEISIPQSEFTLHNVNLAGLTEVQVWFGYQFIRQ